MNPTPRAARILLVDDHAVVRDGLKELIGNEPDLQVIGEAKDPAEAIAQAEVLRPQIILLDHSLGGQLALGLIRELQAVAPQASILVLSMHDEKVFAQRALQAGARGFVGKHEDTSTILRALRRVAQGKTFVSDVVSDLLLTSIADSKKADSRSGLERLSDRELETLRLIGMGLRTHEVAKKLGVGVKTVETHRSRIKEKLGVQSANEVVVLAANWLRDGFLGGAETIGTPTLVPTGEDPALSVLVVDDEDDVLNATRRLLSREGMTVHTAPSGTAALDLLRTTDVDVVLVDLEMPHMHGYELIAALRSEGRLVPVVVLTGHGDAQSTRNAVERGATAFLTKPIDAKLLTRELRRVAAPTARR